jgi:hypothetical protein
LEGGFFFGVEETGRRGYVPIPMAVSLSVMEANAVILGYSHEGKGHKDATVASTNRVRK